MKLHIINRPNLNLLGKRKPETYGIQPFAEYYDTLKSRFPSIVLSYYQSNVEGELINKLHEVGFESDGIILNAGAYTHTSIAIHDAIAAITTPVVEVHISNVYARRGIQARKFNYFKVCRINYRFWYGRICHGIGLFRSSKHEVN